MRQSRTLQWITEKEARHMLVHATSEAVTPKFNPDPCNECPLWPQWMWRWLVSASQKPVLPAYDRGNVLLLEDYCRGDARKDP